MLCCDNVNSGFAYDYAKIFLQQNDGQLVALDSKTAAKILDVGVVDVKQGAITTNALHVFKDKVIAGCSGGKYGVLCYLIATHIKQGCLDCLARLQLWS